MSPRREVNSLLSLTLRSIEEFVEGIILNVSPEIVRYHNECSENDVEIRLASQCGQDNNEDNADIHIKNRENIKDDVEDADEFKFGVDDNYERVNEQRYDVNYRKEVTLDYVERLGYHIFSHIPYNLVEDIKNKVKNHIFHNPITQQC